MKADSGELKAGPRGDGTLDWSEALDWAARANYAGRADWRLPNAKELQSIVDYGRSPQATGSASIDPVFRATAIRDEGGNANWAHYWTSTSHLDGSRALPRLCSIFGEALGLCACRRVRAACCGWWMSMGPAPSAAIPSRGTRGTIPRAWPW
jgi:hypothetical protein